MSGIITIFQQGGWTMFPLAACSLIALTIIIERSLALRRNNVIDPRAVEIIDAYKDGTAEQLAYQLKRVPGAFARIIEEIIKVRHLDHAQAIESMQAVGRTQIHRLERGLTVLEIIGNVSPFLGLLGTVLGMVGVFNAISMQGVGNAQALSAGIAEALITTIAGLFIAIPAVAFYSIFSRRVEELAAEMQDRATAFIVRLQSER